MTRLTLDGARGLIRMAERLDGDDWEGAWDVLYDMRAVVERYAVTGDHTLKLDSPAPKMYAYLETALRYCAAKGYEPFPPSARIEDRWRRAVRSCKRQAHRELERAERALYRPMGTVTA